MEHPFIELLPPSYLFAPHRAAVIVRRTAPGVDAAQAADVAARTGIVFIIKSIYNKYL
jgi:hypothetical protein